MRVYISGPITGNPNWRREFSLAHQKLMKEKVWDGGIVNPLLLSTRLEVKTRVCSNREPTYDEYLDNDIIHLADCTHIYMLKGWSKSKGCNKEVEFARAHNIIQIGAKE